MLKISTYNRMAIDQAASKVHNSAFDRCSVKLRTDVIKHNGQDFGHEVLVLTMLLAEN